MHASTQHEATAEAAVGMTDKLADILQTKAEHQGCGTSGGSGKANYVAKAIDELAANKPVTTKETKPYGCNVKYAK